MKHTDWLAFASVLLLAQKGGTTEEYLTWQWFMVSCCLDFLLGWSVSYVIWERVWRAGRWQRMGDRVI